MDIGERSSSQVDFTEWISNDPGKKFIISPEQVSWNHVDRTLSIEVFKDYTENHFKDFAHIFSAQLNEIDNKSPTNRHIITLWEMGNRDGNSLIIYANQVRDSKYKWTIVFHQRKNGKNVWVYVGTHQYDIDKKYFFTVIRNTENCRIIVCEDVERANRIEDSGFKVGVADPYRFLSVAVGINVNVDREDWSSGSIENLKTEQIMSVRVQLARARTLTKGLTLSDSVNLTSGFVINRVENIVEALESGPKTPEILAEIDDVKNVIGARNEETLNISENLDTEKTLTLLMRYASGVAGLVLFLVGIYGLIWVFPTNVSLNVSVAYVPCLIIGAFLLLLSIRPESITGAINLGTK